MGRGGLGWLAAQGSVSKLDEFIVSLIQHGGREEEYRD